MNVFEYAMQMEKDGEAYYRSAAARVEHKGIRSILTMLADAEVSHYRLFETMRFNQKPELDDSRYHVLLRANATGGESWKV